MLTSTSTNVEISCLAAKTGEAAPSPTRGLVHVRPAIDLTDWLTGWLTARLIVSLLAGCSSGMTVRRIALLNVLPTVPLTAC